MAEVADLIARLEPASETRRFRDDPRRWKAAMALGRLGSAAKPAVAALVNALKDSFQWEEWDFRHAFVDALGAIGPGAAWAVPNLIEALNRADLVAPAAEALGKIGPAAYRAIPRLESFLGVVDDRFGDVGQVAAEALSQIRGQACDDS